MIKDKIKQYAPESIISALSGIKKFIFKAKIFLIKLTVVPKQWRKDKKNISALNDNNKEIYYAAQAMHYYKFKDFANIAGPKSYNDKIQWLKIFEQDKLLTQQSKV